MGAEAKFLQPLAKHFLQFFWLPMKLESFNSVWSCTVRRVFFFKLIPKEKFERDSFDFQGRQIGNKGLDQRK